MRRARFSRDELETKWDASHGGFLIAVPKNLGFVVKVVGIQLSKAVTYERAETRCLELGGVRSRKTTPV